MMIDQTLLQGTAVKNQLTYSFRDLIDLIKQAANDCFDQAMTHAGTTLQLKFHSFGSNLNGAYEQLLATDFASHTAEFTDAASAITQECAKIDKAVGALEDAILTAKNIVAIAQIVGGIAQLAAGIASKMH